eukprot:scaffold13927_cov32-Tisochrysis_lutea.AAC.3
MRLAASPGGVELARCTRMGEAPCCGPPPLRKPHPRSTRAQTPGGWCPFQGGHATAVHRPIVRFTPPSS